MNEKDVLNLIKKDKWMVDILKATREINLSDWWIGAGFVRSKVWDNLHNYKNRTPIPDIDVIYFDKNDFLEEEAGAETTKSEIKYENELKKIMPSVNWSVTNQARMYINHNHSQYKTSSEGLSYWVETATCIGVRLDDKNELVLTAPHGIDDLVNLTLRPTKGSYKDTKMFEERIAKKNWLIKWPKLKVVLE